MSVKEVDYYYHYKELKKLQAPGAFCLFSSNHLDFFFCASSSSSSSSSVRVSWQRCTHRALSHAAALKAAFIRCAGQVAPSLGDKLMHHNSAPLRVRTHTHTHTASNGVQPTPSTSTSWYTTGRLKKRWKLQNVLDRRTSWFREHMTSRHGWRCRF